MKNKVSYNYLDMELKSTDTFSRNIISAVENKQPYSFVRLGDGEGALLDFNLKSNFFDIEYLKQHFGFDCTIQEALDLKETLEQSIKCADIVGVREDINKVKFPDTPFENTSKFLSSFKESFHLRKVEKNLNFADAKRIAMLHKYLSSFSFTASTAYVSQHVGWDFYPSGALPYILSKQKKIGLISSRKGLDKVISKAFGIEVVQYQIPDKFELVQNYQLRHYPTVYNKIINDIKVDYPGMVFIVAGGIVGKGYCTSIKEKGGIALDLGGVVDAWVGRLSRPLPLKERYDLTKNWQLKMKKKIIPTLQSTYNVPDELIMNQNNTLKLIERWKNTAL